MILSGRFSNENNEDINSIPANESTVFSKEELDPIIRIRFMDYDMDRQSAGAPMSSNPQRTCNPVTLMPDSVGGNIAMLLANLLPTMKSMQASES